MIGVGVEEEDRMDQWIEDAESVSDSISLCCDDRGTAVKCGDVPVSSLGGLPV